MSEHATLEGIRQFHVGDILSITTGRLVSPRHMDGVCDILNYMTDDDLFTHQLPRASEECAPSLKAQHPDLDVELEIPEGLGEPDKFQSFIGELVIKFGEDRPVLPLHPESHTHINPIEELADMVDDPNKIFVFDYLDAKEQDT